MRKLIGLGCALLLAFGLSFGSYAGSITDTDGDGVPDSFDNCISLKNGPLATEPGTSCSGNEDSDTDGYGDLCDADFLDGADLPPRRRQCAVQRFH